MRRYLFYAKLAALSLFFLKDLSVLRKNSRFYLYQPSRYQKFLFFDVATFLTWSKIFSSSLLSTNIVYLIDSQVSLHCLPHYVISSMDYPRLDPHFSKVIIIGSDWSDSWNQQLLNIACLLDQSNPNSSLRFYYKPHPGQSSTCVQTLIKDLSITIFPIHNDTDMYYYLQEGNSLLLMGLGTSYLKLSLTQFYPTILDVVSSSMYFTDSAISNYRNNSPPNVFVRSLHSDFLNQ